MIYQNTPTSTIRLLHYSLCFFFFSSPLSFTSASPFLSWSTFSTSSNPSSYSLIFLSFFLASSSSSSTFFSLFLYVFILFYTFPLSFPLFLRLFSTLFFSFFAWFLSMRLLTLQLISTTIPSHFGQFSYIGI